MEERQVIALVLGTVWILSSDWKINVFGAIVITIAMVEYSTPRLVKLVHILVNFISTPPLGFEDLLEK